MSGYEAVGASSSARATPADVAMAVPARIALACMDLTSLGDADTALNVASLVSRSAGPFGGPAALCVWPKFVGQVAGTLGALQGHAAWPANCEGPKRPRVAAVANFPSGQQPLEAVLAQVRQILAQGGEEVDLVLDWRALQGGVAHEVERAAQGVRAVRQVCGPASLKLIIESGELREPALIALACRIGLNEGVDFLKTSTGKTSIGAKPEAARVMLEAIAAHPRGARVGFKASGGVRTVHDAAVYIDLVRQVLGETALVPARFRIGASSLLDDVEAVLAAARASGKPKPTPRGESDRADEGGGSDGGGGAD